MGQLSWQFVLGADAASQIIAWWGQGYGGYSHVDFLLPSGECLGARSDVINGIPAGVQIRPAGYAKWKARRVVTLQCTEEESAAGEAFLRNQIGDKYDKRDILGLLIGRPISSGKGYWICSAVELAMLEFINRMPKFSVTPQQCPPNMLLVILEAIGAV
jgi:hypothetical protein